jgi:starch synthase
VNVSVIVGGRFHAFDLAAHLHRRGALHRLVTNYPKFVARRWGIPPDRVVSLPGTLIAARAMSKVSSQLVRRNQYRLHRWFAKAAAKKLEGSDLVVAWSSFAEPSVAWARERGVPTLVERGSAHILEQDELLKEEHALLGFPWPGIDRDIVGMEMREYEACTQISIPSLFVERSFVRRGITPERLFRNPYGVDLRSFRPPPQPPDPPSPSRLKIVFAGTSSVQKGTHHLLRAFEEARQTGWQLTLVGAVAAEARGWLEPAPRGIMALGHRPQHELASVYANSHCFVMPSIQEGLAMVQVQALACGLPLIATTNTGGEDLLRLRGNDGISRDLDVAEYPAGFIVPIRRPDAIAWCLSQLASSPDLWRSKREEALGLASASLSWEHYGDRALSRYRSVLGSSRPETHHTELE